MRYLSLLLPLAFLLASCGNTCDGFFCQDNGGTCIDGVCICPPGYTGDFCNIEQVPVSITIEDITVQNYPATDADGNPWDEFSNADLIAVLSRDQVVQAVTDTLLNAPLSGGVLAGAQFPFMVTGPFEGDWTVQVFDQDNPDRTFILGYRFSSLYPAGQDFPGSFVLSAPPLDFRVSLRLTYEF